MKKKKKHKWKKKKRSPLSKSVLEDRFFRAWKWKYPDLPEPRREYKFHPTRRWRFDFAWKKWKFAVEIHGGSWHQGGHNRPKSQAKDFEKQREAIRRGWRVLQYNSVDIGTKGDGRIYEVVEDVASILTDAKEIE